MNRSDSCSSSSSSHCCSRNLCPKIRNEGDNRSLKPSSSPSGFKRSRDVTGSSGVARANPKKAKPPAAAALLRVRQLSDDGDVVAVRLVDASTGLPCDSIRLEPDRPRTVGRSPCCSEFAFNDPRVSKRHCQFLFDAALCKIYLLRGAFSISGTSTSLVSEFRNRLGLSHGNGEPTAVSGCDGSFRPSLNGLFVNGVPVGNGSVKELSDGDEVLLVCANGINSHGVCRSPAHIGFFIERILFLEPVRGEARDDNTFPLDRPRPCFSPVSSGKVNKRVFALRANQPGISRSKTSDLVGKATTFLTLCRSILGSDDPISYIRERAALHYQVDETYSCSFGNEFPVLKAIENPHNCEVQAKSVRCMSCINACMDCGRVAAVKSDTVVTPSEMLVPVDVECGGVCLEKFPRVFSKNAFENNNPHISRLNNLGNGSSFYSAGSRLKKCSTKFVPSPGKNFYLNRLGSTDCGFLCDETVVSLPELVCPVKTISRIFIATFTCDLLWFLSYCEIPGNLPVTVACHNAERCWSVSPDMRSSAPYPAYPNLVAVYPPFPEAIAFGKDHKKQGIACHHPKLLVLQREDHIRVIITSANLVEKQWNSVTNTIWWQDFPRASSSDYLSLFNQINDMDVNRHPKSDFAAQLAGFMASLVSEAPSQAYWMAELAKYDFGGATGYLVSSVPGIYSYRASSSTNLLQTLPGYYHGSGASDLKYLGSVEAFVVGLSHLFRTADKCGVQLRKLAMFLGKFCEKAYGMPEVVLRRNKSVPADANAVSIFVADLKEFSADDCVQLGFLPRNVAKWVSPLWDAGFFKFCGYVNSQDALAAAMGTNSMKVQLILQVLQGPNFDDMPKLIQPTHLTALCSLIASIQRCTGLWRLEQVLNLYKWPEHLESDFIYGSSSIGSSVNAKFLAAFSSASGKRLLQSMDSEESDPEWGCWSASQESKCPSIRILFPTIQRVKTACSGILPSKRILCFSEKTWERLKTMNILHDAIPHPRDRVGHPMHVKVARRRFQSKTGASPFGWVYCGSHNFSAAAWGRLLNGPGKADPFSSTRLHVCNYELGIVFVFPPSEMDSNKKGSKGLDDIVLPFAMPAPKYGHHDCPATMQAMREALAEVLMQEGKAVDIEAEGAEEVMEEIPDEEEPIEAAKLVSQETVEENAYAQVLWGQVDSC